MCKFHLIDFYGVAHRGWWRKQAPAWNEVVRRFANNDDVAFGDINLSEQQIRGDGNKFNPGKGGWPTIRYFNKETGYDGAEYTKKTDKSMCDELGDLKLMEAYVTEAGQTSLCTVLTGKGCSEKELEFAEKYRSASPAEISSQYKRLAAMVGNKVKPALAEWIAQRVSILKQLGGTHEEL